MPTIKQIFSSRTNQFAIVLAILSALYPYIDILPLSRPWVAAVGVLVSVVTIILRFMTTQALADK
jgi:hypothetical protein